MTTAALPATARPAVYLATPRRPVRCIVTRAPGEDRGRVRAWVVTPAGPVPPGLVRLRIEYMPDGVRLLMPAWLSRRLRQREPPAAALAEGRFTEPPPRQARPVPPPWPPPPGRPPPPRPAPPPPEAGPVHKRCGYRHGTIGHTVTCGDSP